MAQAAPEKWFILRRRVGAAVNEPVPLGLNVVLDDGPHLFELRLPVEKPPPRITTLAGRMRNVVPPGQVLSIVATSSKDLLLELGRPNEPNTPGTFFLAVDFTPDGRAAAARRAFDVSVTRLPNRVPGLPPFSGARNVGFLNLGSGTHVVAELQATNRQADNHVPFITLRSDKQNDDDDDTGKVVWDWNQTSLLWPAVDDAANPGWTTHDVIAHDRKLWWVNLSRGLVACDPAPVDELLPQLAFVALPVLAGFEDRPQELAAEIERYRTVGVSAGAMRFVDVTRRRNYPVEETRVVVWTLDLPAEINQARWEDNPRVATLRDIRNSANYAPMPRNGVPTVLLVHPNEPGVVYFSLGRYVFSVDVNVNQNAVVHRAAQGAVPQGPINNQRDVLAWERPPFKLHAVPSVYRRTARSATSPASEDPAER